MNLLEQQDFVWIVQALCTVHRKPFSQALLEQQYPAPYSQALLHKALETLEFSTALKKCALSKMDKQSFPTIAWCKPAAGPNGSDHDIDKLKPVLILQAETDKILVLAPGDLSPVTLLLSEFAKRYSGRITAVMPNVAAGIDPDHSENNDRKFGFSWFVPELLKHKRLWHEILLASLVIQLIALATPLFTQTIIDKVVVHHTQSTLIVIAIGMAVFMLFSAALSWLRQYLVLHTGNRVDAVLGSSVFERLFKLPPIYFQHRPTGVISARLQGVENIREFIASAAITLILDLPFLLIFVAIMFYYSVKLTLIVLAFLGVIVLISLLVAPIFQIKLQKQFQLGARNQAFITEYVAGLETVKSLQLEPQLNNRFSGYLASYLSASFDTKQTANTYNTASNLLEQLMTLLVLALGAYTVMHDNTFTIGMLVAFQMFSGKLSQPAMRIVGLWQQFQQARLSVDRLGDLMNAPIEPYSTYPTREASKQGVIKVENIAFRYLEHLPMVYQNVSLDIHPGQTVAIMGPSGCGKSTLAKLLQGFYQPTEGRIFVDGTDIRFLSANELRSHFGVVPQETVLFSGTIYENLQIASPNATFEQVVQACKLAEIHAVIESQPKGYQTEIGERGAGLSGGQRQRIAIARALLKRPSILIFDEATSSLDGQTAEQFAQTVNALRGKVTMLFITHGLPKGLHIDAVYRLSETGTYLLSQQSSAVTQHFPGPGITPGKDQSTSASVRGS